MHLFRSLALITKEYSRVALLNNAGGHGVSICIAITCVYAAIRFNGMLSITLGVIGMNITTVFAAYVTTVGNINWSSKKSVTMVRQQPAALHRAGKDIESKWLQREIRCLQDLRIQMGSVFFYDKALVLTTFEIILQNIVNLLLLY